MFIFFARIHLYIHICVFIHKCTQIYVHICMCVHIHTYMCIYRYIYVYNSEFTCQQERPLLKNTTRLTIVCVTECVCFPFASLGKHNRTHHNHIMDDESHTFS